MDSLIAKKILEAQECVKNAEKSLKTSLFKRTPDYDTAASEYNKAAMACKISKQFDKSIEYSQKSADCFIKLNSPFNAAKQYEQVAFICSETKNYSLLSDSINKAADLFLENGTRDSAGILLEKGANMLKANDPEKALHLFKRAIYIAEVEDKYHEMSSLFESSIIIAIRLKKLNDAVELIKKHIDVLERIQAFDSVNKQVLTLVVIYLSKDDWVSATREVEAIKRRYHIDNESKAFGYSDDLISAYDEKDADRFNLAIKSYLTYSVDNEVLKLAQTITKTGDWNVNLKPKEDIKQSTVSSSSTITTTSYAEPPITKFEDIVTDDVTTADDDNNKKVDDEEEEEELDLL